jgi:epoxyqueuosine reductase QueG
MGDNGEEIVMKVNTYGNGESRGGEGIQNPYGKTAQDQTVSPQRAGLLSSETVRQICLEAGAHDAGFVEVGREALQPGRADILRVYPGTQSLISLVFAMNRENIRSQARYLYADEINQCGDEIATSSRAILRRLNHLGARGAVMIAAFPMDMTRFPGKTWDVSHKTVAVEAGLGHMGVNRLLIHPQCGNFVLLNTILIDARLDHYGTRLGESPCIDCGLCAAVCPVGAIKRQGSFDLMACMTHSYRDNARGFLDWIDAMISSGDMADYRNRFRDSETASIWQSLMYKLDYKCGYCMAVCPAGKDVEPGFRDGKKAFMKEIFKPLKNRVESVYVRAGSEAESRAKRNPNKDVRRVGV